MRTKSKTNTNRRTQLNLSKLCTHLRLGREKRRGGGKRPIIAKLPLKWQNTPPKKIHHHLPHWVSRRSIFFCHCMCPHAPPEWCRGRWRAYASVAWVGLLYRFINFIIKKITKIALRAYKYYEKTMLQIQKYPRKAAFNFSKSKGHEILLYIKYAKK